MIEISRIREAIERQGERFLKRVFTAQELAVCAGNTSSLAARFAAKEAVAKALGTGLGKVAWTDVEILRGESGEPVLILHGTARRLAEEMGLNSWAISLSHTRENSVAQVIASTD